MFFGWKIVFLAFGIAFFAFGIGFYSLSIYLVALHADHGWPIAFISLAITVYSVDQFTFAFGPGLLGVVRDWSGSYATALALCVVCEVVAAIVIVMGRRRRDIRDWPPAAN